MSDNNFDMASFMNTLNGIKKEETQEPAAQVQIPQNDQQSQIEAEEAFLSYALMQCSNGQENSFPFITPAHFTHPFLRDVYKVVYDCFQNGFRLSFPNLSAKFQNEQDREYLKNIFIGEKNGYLATQSTAYDLDEIYRKREVKRSLQNMLNNIDLLMFNELSKAVDNFKSKIDALLLSPFHNQGQMTHKEAIEHFKKQNREDNNIIIPTLIDSLDNLLGGGFCASELIVIGARPSMGKTALAITFMNNIAIQDFHVLNFSLEMTNHQTMARFIALENKTVNYTDLTKKKLSFDEVDRLADNAQTHDNITHDYSQVDVNQICSLAERKAKELLRMGKRLDCVCVDYLQIIPKDKGNKNENEAIAEVTKALKLLAKRLNIVVILLSQLNRDIEKEASIESKRPNMSHLRQSGAIEQDADVVLFPFRPSQYERDVEDGKQLYYKDYFEIIAGKNRQGEIGIARAFCDMGKNIIRDTDRENGFTAAGISAQAKGKRNNNNNSQGLV